MADGTGIEWADATWNPIIGCTRVSSGCMKCYAERMALRFAGPDGRYEGLVKKVGDEPRWTGEVRLVDSVLAKPLSWRRPRRIFVNSMGDLFHEKVPDEWIDQAFGVMALAPQHQFLILTKRPERMLAWFRRECDLTAPVECLTELYTGHPEIAGRHPFDKDAAIGVGLRGWPLPNVWLGVSVEDQATADERIPLLLDTPAAVRFISAEPLLAPIDLEKWLPGCHECALECGFRAGETQYPEEEKCNYCGNIYASKDLGELCPNCRNQCWSGVCPSCGGNVVQDHHDTQCLDWVIVGGESGPGVRPMHPAWARGVRDQCQAAGVPFFFKQWGEWQPMPADSQWSDFEHIPATRKTLWSSGDSSILVGKARAGRLLDGREWNEVPT